MNYLTFHNAVAGYKFYSGTNQVFTFELYWGKVNLNKLLKGETKYTVVNRKKR